MQFEVVVIGASAGGIEILSTILRSLPVSYPFGIVVVLHLSSDRRSRIAELFQSMCHFRVKEVDDKEVIEAGTVYFAPSDYHVLIEPDHRLSLSIEEPVQYSRPSIDVLFESAAEAYRDRLLGIVLTGANSDGAHGLRTVCDFGGVAIVQQPETAYASAMPRAALAACPEAQSMLVTEISEYLKSIVGVEPY